MSKGPSLLVRLTIYPLVAILFSFIVFLVVTSAAGYQIEYKDGKIQVNETGIIIINTKPGEADVYLDGDLYRKKTPGFTFFDLKINRVSVGDHNLKISKEGYEVWDSNINVKPGLVTWVNYLLLAPQEKEIEKYNINGEIKGIAYSFDKEKQLIYSYDEEEKVNTITEINNHNKEQKSLYEFLSKDDSTLSIVSYSHDSQRFLLRKTLGEDVSYIIYETKEEGRSWNITSLFDLRPDALVFSPYSHDKIYGLKDSKIYELDFITKVQSAIIAQDVNSIHFDPDKLIYVQESDENHSLWTLDSSNKKQMIVKALPASERYKVSYINETKDYMILVSDENDLILYSNGDDNPTLETISGSVSSYSLSPAEERVGYVKGESYFVYDFEKEEYFETLNNTKLSKITWLYDDSNLMYMGEDDKIYMVNYDGKYNNYLFDSSNKLPIISAPGSLNIFFGVETEQLDQELTTELFGFTFSS